MRVWGGGGGLSRWVSDDVSYQQVQKIVGEINEFDIVLRHQVLSTHLFV